MEEEESEDTGVEEWGGEGSPEPQWESEQNQDEEDSIASVLSLFQSKDFIMEPGVFPGLSRYFQLGGEPGPVIDQLSSNYVGLAQMCNLVGEWLVESGTETEEVGRLFEASLSALLTRHFNSKKADAIFEQSDNSGIEWLPHLIAHAPWRRLVYSLADNFPECLMLNFAVKLISDAGFQHEISSVTTAAQQLEIFSRVLIAAVEAVLAQTPDTAAADQAFQELVRVACVAEHTFLYTVALLHVLSKQSTGPARGSVDRLSQMLRKAVGGEMSGVKLAESLGGGQETSGIALALSLGPSPNPNLLSALFSMLSKRALNPADVTLLYDYYQQARPPPVGLLRQPEFLHLLIHALFNPKAPRLHPSHKSDPTSPNAE